MKKIYYSIVALALLSFCKVSTAQVTVTLQVDVSKETTINGAGMRVGGTFAANGATNGANAMLDWSPDDANSAMTDLGSGLWSIDVTFPSSAIGDTLQFKFVNGTWYPTGTNEDANGDHSLVDGGCSPASGGAADNRLLEIPAASGLVYRWCYDSCTQCNGADALVTGVVSVKKGVSVFSLAPNPSVNKTSTLMYSVSENSAVNISLYNVLGQSVETIVNTTRPSGLYNQKIDMTNLKSGVYFIQVTTGKQTVSKKIIVN